MLKIGSEYIWLWVATEPENSQILALLLLKNLKRETCLLPKDSLLDGLVKFNGKHPVSMDGGTWYPMACKFLGLKHQTTIPLMRKA